ncbi:hypothetical protein [Paenibacillus pinihumi]|uniref:hypothetical protein n=1 Tax=Paenibacillus pinihumi TaxID=669462 RepID=UPI0003FC0A14|nr:hypothetical protein [Paenibacillus pinihumi]
MNKKIPVQISPYIRTQYSYEKLKICRSCGNFTVLGDEECGACGKSALVPAQERAAYLTGRSAWLERLLALVLWGAGIGLGTNDMEWAVAGAAGLILMVLLIVMQNKFAETRYRHQLARLFKRGEEQLVEGLGIDHDEAIEVFKEGDKPLAYEMLREVGMLVRTDQLRMEQILLLQSFILRKDMDLMLEPLLTHRFSADLVEYIGELAKVRKDLIKEKAFRYVLVHELQILRMEQGEQILTRVAGAAVRMKRYVIMYPHLLVRYAGKLPKDRFLRLCMILKSEPARNWGEVGIEVYAIFNARYKHDPEFQSLGGMTFLAGSTRYSRH